MLVSNPAKPIKLLPIKLIGYVSKKGNGIYVSEKTSEFSRKIRIFSDGSADSIYFSKTADWATRTHLKPETFNNVLEKYQKPESLNLFQITDIFKEVAEYLQKNGCRRIWWHPSGKNALPW